MLILRKNCIIAKICKRNYIHGKYIYYKGLITSNIQRKHCLLLERVFCIRNKSILSANEAIVRVAHGCQTCKSRKKTYPDNRLFCLTEHMKPNSISIQFGAMLPIQWGCTVDCDQTAFQGLDTMKKVLVFYSWFSILNSNLESGKSFCFLSFYFFIISPIPQMLLRRKYFVLIKFYLHLNSFFNMR